MAIFMGQLKKKPKNQISGKRVPIQIYPRIIESKYANYVEKLAREQRKLEREILYPQLEQLYKEFSRDFGSVRTDDFLGLLQRIIRGIILRHAEMIDKAEPDIARVAAEIEIWSKGQHARVIRSVLGVNVLETDSGVSAALNLWIKQNVALIKNISTDEARKIEDMVTNAYRTGISHTALRDGLSDLWEGKDKRKTEWVKGFSVPQRAALVARDQIGKLNGQISSLRQTNLGVERYIWRTSLDERVRGNPNGLYPNAQRNHWKLEGKIFYWDPTQGPVPPNGLIPGSDYQCRCYAEPVLEDLLGLDVI